MSAPSLLAKLHRLGHDAFRYDGPPVIYIDPWKLPADSPPADLVLVTHDHFDHCSPADVKKISGPTTVVIACPAAAAKLPGAHALRPGEQMAVGEVTVEAVPAYNVNKFRSPGVPFHPQAAGYNGYIVTALRAGADARPTQPRKGHLSHRRRPRVGPAAGAGFVAAGRDPAAVAVVGQASELVDW